MAGWGQTALFLRDCRLDCDCSCCCTPKYSFQQKPKAARQPVHPRSCSIACCEVDSKTGKDLVDFWPIRRACCGLCDLFPSNGSYRQNLLALTAVSQRPNVRRLCPFSTLFEAVPDPLLLPGLFEFPEALEVFRDSGIVLAIGLSP